MKSALDIVYAFALIAAVVVVVLQWLRIGKLRDHRDGLLAALNAASVPVSAAIEEATAGSIVGIADLQPGARIPGDAERVVERITKYSDCYWVGFTDGGSLRYPLSCVVLVLPSAVAP